MKNEEKIYLILDNYNVHKSEFIKIVAKILNKSYCIYHLIHLIISNRKNMEINEE